MRRSKGLADAWLPHCMGVSTMAPSSSIARTPQSADVEGPHHTGLCSFRPAIQWCISVHGCAQRPAAHTSSEPCPEPPPPPVHTARFDRGGAGAIGPVANRAQVNPQTPRRLDTSTLAHSAHSPRPTPLPTPRRPWVKLQAPSPRSTSQIQISDPSLISKPQIQASGHKWGFPHLQPVSAAMCTS